MLKRLVGSGLSTAKVARMRVMGRRKFGCDALKTSPRRDDVYEVWYETGAIAASWRKVGKQLTMGWMQEVEEGEKRYNHNKFAMMPSVPAA